MWMEQNCEACTWTHDSDTAIALMYWEYQDRWRNIRIYVLLNLLTLCDLAFSLKCEEDFRIANS